MLADTARGGDRRAFRQLYLFSTLLQYLDSTASQVIGRLSPVCMMLASGVILKERMRITQLIGGLLMCFNSSRCAKFFNLSDCQHSVGDFWLLRGDGFGELWRGAKSLAAMPGIETDFVVAVCFVYNGADGGGEAVDAFAINRRPELACLLFCGLNTLVGYGALAGSASERRYYPTLTPLFNLIFLICWRCSDLRPSRRSR